MEEADLSKYDRADSASSNERPNANGEPYDPVSNAEDVYQDQDVYGVNRPVSVCVETPVRTHELPARLGGLLRKAVANLSAGGQPVKLLDADPRRRRASLYFPITKTLQLGMSNAEAASSFSFIVTSSDFEPGRIDFFSASEVWGVGVGAAFDVSVLNEQWTP